MSVVNSFGWSFVWMLWLGHQVRSVVAATTLADATQSDHDSPNAPATARSVYVIAHPAARPPRGLHHGCGLLPPILTVSSAGRYLGPPDLGARSVGGEFGAVVSFRWSLLASLSVEQTFAVAVSKVSYAG
jgi:hypothetical protein